MSIERSIRDLESSRRVLDKALADFRDSLKYLLEQCEEDEELSRIIRKEYRWAESMQRLVQTMNLVRQIQRRASRIERQANVVKERHLKDDAVDSAVDRLEVMLRDFLGNM